MTTVPRLTITQDNEFWFTAAKEGRLEIQRCVDCRPAIAMELEVGFAEHARGEILPQLRLPDGGVA